MSCLRGVALGALITSALACSSLQTVRVQPENLSVGQLRESEIAFHKAEYERLRSVLQSAYDESQLPELPSDETRAALNDLLVRVRLKTAARTE